MNSSSPLSKLILVVTGILLFWSSALGQDLAPLQSGFRGEWYSNEKPWHLIVTTQTGMHAVNVGNLISRGFPENSVEADQLKIYYKGDEIPVEIRNDGTSTLNAGDSLIFYGRRNTGDDELWAYGYDPENQASDYYSAYSDSSYYWVTYDDSPSRRYSEESSIPTGNNYPGYRDTTHYETDATSYYIGHGDDAELSILSESEGFYWYSLNLINTNSRTVTLDGDLHYLALVDSSIYVTSRFTSLSDGQRTSRINLRFNRNGSTNFHTIGETRWTDKGGGIAKGEVSPVGLVDYEQMEFQFRLINNNSGNAFNNAHILYFDWFEYSYFRRFGFLANRGQASFWHRSDGQRSYEIEGAANTGKVDVYMPFEDRVIQAELSGETAVFTNDQAAVDREHYIAVKDDRFFSPKNIRSYQSDQDLLSADNSARFLIITRRVFAEQAQQYANYRRAKDNMTTKVVYADDIWRIFGYGEQIPVAFQRFLRYTRETWSESPEFVFILADGELQIRNSVIPSDQIPPFGYPSSDGWFAMNFTSNRDWYPRMKIGRLTLDEPSDITAYLNKVSQYESTPQEYERWQKRLTLLSGGLESAERRQLYLHNVELANLANQSTIAADTVLIGKQSNQPLDESSREDLGSIINSGTFILHFFGHSSPDSWDLLTDNPDQYQNKNRLSIVLSLGCYSGLFTTSSKPVISEQFVKAPNAGIAFIGGTGQGNVASLKNYSRFFYRSIFQNGARRLGDVDVYARTQMLAQYNTVSPPTLDVALVQNSMLLGDPSITLALPDTPDYRFEFNPMNINPNPTNLSDSLFNVNVKVRNLGTRPQTLVPVRFDRLSPGGDRVTQIKNLQPVGITGDINFEVELGDDDAGEHELNFQIDPDNALPEFDEFNNSYTDNHVVFSTGVDLIYPTSQGILTDRDPEFVLSTPSIFEGLDVIAQVDSTPDFDNPLIEDTLSAVRASIQWRPDTRFDHGQDYYWRARVDKPDEINWRMASFLVDSTYSGIWWQQQQSDFTNNQFNTSLNFQRDDGFDFSTVNLEIRTSTLTYRLANQPEFQNYPASTFVNGEQMGRLDISFFMIVINGLTGEIRNGIDSQGIPRGQHYDVHPGIFTNDGARTRSAFIQDLNAVNPGDYVILRVRNFRLISPQTPLFSGQNDPLLRALRSVGGFQAGGGLDGTRPPELTTTDGYILFGKKFASADEYDPDEVSEYIIRDGLFEADTTLSFNTSEGVMSSPNIGPVTSWGDVEARADLIDQTGKVFLDVYGMESPGENPERLTTLNPSGLNSTITGSLSSIDANEYPYIQLRARLNNPSRNTPQLDYWRVGYEPVPEIAIDPFTAEVETDTLEEGYPFEFNVNLRNIGLAEADSVVVEYLDVYQANESTQPTTTLITRDTVYNLEHFNKPINRAPVTTRPTSATIPTLGKVGNHRLQVRFHSSFLDQYQYNNFLFRDFYVRPDTTSPKIEVFVDNRFLPPVGEPILDKENPSLSYVSTKPIIDIYWKDNNPFLPITDSSSVEIRAFSVNPNNFRTYTAADPELSFVPAKGDQNEAYVQFMPDYTDVSDTVITLQVLSADDSGNLAEDDQQGYLVSFRVSTKAGMTNFYPYPNPMSNFTNFAFELQGEDISQVERLKLKIFTLSGRPVKVVDLLEDQHLLNDGRLRIGWNIYRWNARDDDGDPLASGVYLYYVDFKADGQSIDVNNNTSVEKLVIIR